MEQLYQILKKNVETISLDSLANGQSKIYTDEYYDAMYVYLTTSNKEAWLERYKAIRVMESNIAAMVAQQIMKSFNVS